MNAISGYCVNCGCAYQSCQCEPVRLTDAAYLKRCEADDTRRTRIALKMAMLASKQEDALIEDNKRLREENRTLKDAIRRLHHWHDWGEDNEGMVVSSDAVRGLWALADEGKP